MELVLVVEGGRKAVVVAKAVLPLEGGVVRGMEADGLVVQGILLEADVAMLRQVTVAKNN